MEVSLQRWGLATPFSGWVEAVMRGADVAFAIKTILLRKLAGPPKGINESLMTICLTLPIKHYVTSITAYAFTMANLDNVKEKFYEDHTQGGQAHHSWSLQCKGWC